ncbi:hypothetical protein C8A00DRAFT_37409 [Chaetomidium leptoderma]|uniref:Uncharacterized protein n=1 Tax=Chaetomidium leptoderma TaxID=669021 RepID=A0AAN6ZTZ1_9PEZI|nr:hypothetical protein C8A00DRAFT_37409 [Chaetomidium leptoderma]
MSNTTEDPAVTIQKTNAKAGAQAVFEAAKNRLTTAQEHLKNTQELYLQSSKQLLEQQTKLTEIQGELIYQAAITVRAYFSVFGDNAIMWVTLSTDNIMPGLQMVEEMTLDRGGLAAAQQKAARLNAWSVQAQQAVKDIAAKQRVDEIQAITRELPPTPDTKKAIEASTGEVLNIAKEATKENAAVAPINRFGMKREL